MASTVYEMEISGGDVFTGLPQSGEQVPWEATGRRGLVHRPPKGGGAEKLGSTSEV